MSFDLDACKAALADCSGDPSDAASRFQDAGQLAYREVERLQQQLAECYRLTGEKQVEILRAAFAAAERDSPQAIIVLQERIAELEAENDRLRRGCHDTLDEHDICPVCKQQKGYDMPGYGPHIDDAEELRAENERLRAELTDVNVAEGYLERAETAERKLAEARAFIKG